MGNSFEVWAWETDGFKGGKETFKWVNMYGGEDKSKAFYVLHELKRQGVGCVKLEWRGKYKNGE